MARERNRLRGGGCSLDSRSRCDDPGFVRRGSHTRRILNAKLNLDGFDAKRWSAGRFKSTAVLFFFSFPFFCHSASAFCCVAVFSSAIFLVFLIFQLPYFIISFFIYYFCLCFSFFLSPFPLFRVIPRIAQRSGRRPQSRRWGRSFSQTKIPVWRFGAIRFLWHLLWHCAASK